MTLASHVPADWNDILSTTMANYHKTLTDNVFNQRPLLQHLMGNGRVKTIGGGHAIVEPLMYAEGEMDSYDEWETISVSPQNTATAAQYPWKQLFATIAISGLEEAQNSGREQIIDLLEAKITQAEDTLKTGLNRMLFGTRGGAAKATDFGGLPTLISAATTAAGGIVNEAWWASFIDGDVGNATLDAAGLEAALRTAYNKTSDAGPDNVDAIFTNDYGFGFYESTLTPQVRYTDTDKANLGFQNLMFKNVPIMWDFDCPGADDDAGTVTTSDTQACFYGVNSKYVGLKVHKDRNFKQSPFSDNLAGSVSSTGAAVPVAAGTAVANALDARVSFITTFGNLVTRNRRRLFKVTNVAEA